MGSRGRRSLNELATIPALVETSRPPPPFELSQAERAIWRDVTGTMPSGWFSKAQFPILASYCRHTARAGSLSDQINCLDVKDLNATDGIDRLNRLLAMAERETRALISCARSMRLTHQAQIFPRGAGRSIASGQTGPRPWEWPSIPIGQDPMFDDYIGDEKSEQWP